jgi:EAL and modified HD-GYP domain-containing signal transduction protein
MVQSVLGSLILGYRPLWNRARKLAGVQLYVHNEPPLVVDAPTCCARCRDVVGHLTAAADLAANAPAALQPAGNAPRGSPWIEVRGDWLSDSVPSWPRCKAAHQRGLKLVWRGDLARLPPPEVARCFDNSLLTLRPEDADGRSAARPHPPWWPPSHPAQHQPGPGRADVREHGQPCPHGALPGQQRPGAGRLAHGRRALQHAAPAAAAVARGHSS